jgi:hypothetical protein
MKQPDSKPGVEDPTATGLPVFHTWRGVYLFVLGSFVLWVALLFALTMMFR